MKTKRWAIVVAMVLAVLVFVPMGSAPAFADDVDVSGTVKASEYAGKALSATGDTTIEVDKDTSLAGIDASGHKLTIKGQKTLTVKGGIQAKEVSIQNATVNSSGSDEAGIEAKGGVSISGASVTAKGGDYGIKAGGNIAIKDAGCVVVAQGGDGALSSSGGEIVLADKLVFSEPNGVTLASNGKTVVDANGNVVTSLKVQEGEDETFTVSFNVQGHGTAPDSQTVKSGEKAEKPEDPTEDGWDFGGWYTNDGCTDGNEYDFDTPVTDNVPLYAKWTQAADEFTVKFDVKGHGTAPVDQTVKAGGKATEPKEPTASGYTFGGWYTDSDCTSKYDFASEVKASMTLYAKWTAVPTTYTVTFDVQGHGTPRAAQTVESGKTVPEPTAPAASGWVFGGWYIDKACKTAYDFNTPVTKNLTLYAKWTEVFTVTFDLQGHGNARAAQKVESGKTATEPTAPTSSGWTFGGWYKEKECTNKYNFSTPVTQNITLYAKWTQQTVATYTVTFNANGHGTAPAAQKVKSGSTAKKPANPTATGYTFGGWYTEATCKNAYNFNTPVTRNITLYAKWTQSSNGGKGNTTPKTGDMLPIGIVGGVALVALIIAGVAFFARKRSR